MASITARLFSLIVFLFASIASGSPALAATFQLGLEPSELSGTVNGSTVTPMVGPTGSFVVKGAGSVHFVPAHVGQGAYFMQGFQQSSNAAFYRFTGQSIGDVFATGSGEVVVYLKSQLSVAERSAESTLPGGYKYETVFSTYSGDSKNLYYLQVHENNSRIVFHFDTGSGSNRYYHIPVGQEEALFGKNVTLKLKLKWTGTQVDLYLNDVLASTQSYTKDASATFNAATQLFVGTAPTAGGGYYTSRNTVIDDLKITSGSAVSHDTSNSTSADTTAPSIPTGLAATAISSSVINISWAASADFVGVTGYKVYRNGLLIASPAGTAFSDTGLTGATSYTYTVSAVDAAGNTSAQSPSVSSATASTESLVPVNGISDRVVLVTKDGATHTFLKSEAVDKGSFISPAGFTQRNLCDTTTTLPDMTICFRPDADNSRDEVVFEYGTFQQVPTFLMGYSAQMYSGSILLEAKHVVKHTTYQRWRWLPHGYRQRYRAISTLESEKLLPPYRSAYSFNQMIGSPDPKCSYVNIFDLACVTTYMGGTGERDDIGHVTGPQGKYLVSQSDAWWSQVLSQAEAGAGIPWHIRDERGTPINFYRTSSEGSDIVNRLLLNSHSNNTSKPGFLRRPVYSATGNTEAAASTIWSIDQAHQPALFYLPWLLTGDPFYLEEMQFANSNNTLYTAWDRTADNQADLTEDQVRGIAWNLRTMIGLRMTTPAAVPGWLLPRSYFERQSTENAKELVREYVNNTNNLHGKLHIISSGFWQHDFYTFEVGWGKWLGLSEWNPVYDHAIQGSFARVNGTSGWEQRCPTVYYLGGTDSQWTSWSDAWNVEKMTNARTVTDATILCSMDAYTSYLNGVLSLATHIGTPGSDSLHAWLQAKMELMSSANAGYTMGSKWAIAPRYAVGSGSNASSTPTTAILPTVTLQVFPTTILSGEAATLSWTSTNATSCVGVGFSAAAKTSGSLRVTPASSTEYSIVCNGNSGNMTAVVSIKVTGDAAQVGPAMPRVEGGGSATTSAHGISSSPDLRSFRHGTSSATFLQQDLFSIGDQIQTNARANVRSSAGVSNNLISRQIVRATGVITDGPKMGSGFTWWRIKFDTGSHGWVVASVLQRKSLSQKLGNATSSVGAGALKQPLVEGMIHPGVAELQKILNLHLDTRVAIAGPGSPGFETKYFGALTRKAVEKFQVLHGIASSGTLGYGRVGPKTFAKLKELVR